MLFSNDFFFIVLHMLDKNELADAMNYLSLLLTALFFRESKEVPGLMAHQVTMEGREPKV